MRNFATKSSLLLLLISAFAFAKAPDAAKRTTANTASEIPIVEGEPPQPPTSDILALPSVQAKMKEFGQSCTKTFSKNTCLCISKNFALKVNGRDVNESELDMAIAISSRKNVKKFKNVQGYYPMEDMIREIENECVKNPKWEMDQ